MKNFFITLIVVFSLTGCTKTIYTHQQQMQQFNNKNSILSKFGLPTQKREGEGLTEWIYDFGTVSRSTNFGNANTNVSVNANNGNAYGNAMTNVMSVSQFSQFQQYVKFTFDSNGNIIKWDTQGVDFSEKKTATGKTILFTTLYLGIIVGVAALTAF